jgi:hypothetical protein
MVLSRLDAGVASEKYGAAVQLKRDAGLHTVHRSDAQYCG